MPCLIINLLIYIITGIVCSAGAAAIFHVLAHIVINFCCSAYRNLARVVLAIYAKRGVAYIVLLVITFFSSPAVKWLLRGFILFHWYIRKQMVKSFPFYDTVVIFLYT